MPNKFIVTLITVFILTLVDGTQAHWSVKDSSGTAWTIDTMTLDSINFAGSSSVRVKFHSADTTINGLMKRGDIRYNLDPYFDSTSIIKITFGEKMDPNGVKMLLSWYKDTVLHSIVWGSEYIPVNKNLSTLKPEKRLANLKGRSFNYYDLLGKRQAYKARGLNQRRILCQTN